MARGLELNRRRNTDLLSPRDVADPRWQPLKVLVGKLSGTVPHHPDLKWREGIATRVDWADQRLWLLVEPRTVFVGVTEATKGVAADFARERTVKRYNQQLNDLIGFWSTLLAGGGAEIRALGISTGVDAAFRLSADTAFSRRVGVVQS